MWFQKTKNLFDKNAVVAGALSANGSIEAMEGIYTSDFIPVVPNTTYFKGISDSARFKFYNKNKESISNSYTDLTNAGNAQAFVTTENAFYIRLSITTNYLDTLQIEQNLVATDYEPYVEDKIFVKNDNDVYEEFGEKNKKLEIITGVEFETDEKWNGKTIYKKIIDFGTMPNATSKTVAHNIENGETILDINVFCNNANGAFGGLMFPHIARNRAVYGSTSNNSRHFYFNK